MSRDTSKLLLDDINEIKSPRLMERAHAAWEAAISPTFRNTIANYFGKGMEQLNRMRSPGQIEDSTATFQPYLESIREELEELKRIRKGHEKARQTAIEKVQTCYRCVPAGFFNPQFELAMLPARKRAWLQQQQLAQHLDMIEITLFHQINVNFNQYLGLVGALGDLDQLVDRGIQRVKDVRQTMKELNKGYIMKGQKVALLLRKKQAIQKTLEKVKVAHRLIKLPQNLKQITKQKNWSFKVLQAVVQSKNLIDIVGKVTALSRFGSQVGFMHEQARVYLRQQIQLKTSKLLQNSFKYNKEKWLLEGVPKNAIIKEDQDQSISMSVDITVLDNSYMHYQKQNEEQQRLTEQNIRTVEQICDIVGFAHHLGSIDGTLDQSVMQKMQKFDKDFFNDLRDYLQLILEKSGVIPPRSSLSLPQFFEYIEIDFFCKIVEVYFSIIRRVIVKINTLLQTTSHLAFFAKLQKSISDFLISRIRTILALKKINVSVDYQTFLKYLSVMDYWINNDSELAYYNINSLEQTRKELLETYITNLHKQTMTVELKRSMELDIFQPVQIPSDYYQQLEYLFNRNQADESMNALDATVNMSIRWDRKKAKAVDLEDTTTTNQVRVLHRCLDINGQSFQVPQSFLLFIEMLEEYSQMSVCIPDYKHNLEEKVMELMGFYNWYMRELIVNGSICKIPDGSIKYIQIKHLCLAVHVLQLLQLLLEKAPTQRQNLRMKQEKAMKEHMVELLKKIPNLVMFRLQEEMTALYEYKLSAKNAVPTIYSRNIITMMKSCSDTMAQFFAESRIKEFLGTSVKFLSKSYMAYLASLGKRGIQELQWFVEEFEKGHSDIFFKEIEEMKQDLRRRRR